MTPLPLATHPIALTCEILAVVTSACYGVLLARRSGFDLVGIYTLAMLIAFGGGTIRDLCLDRHPLFWIANPSYPVLVFVLAIATTRIRRYTDIFPSWLEGFDAMALGLYTVSGAQAGLAAGTSGFVACLFGVIAGCFGGVVADMMTGQVPRLFRGGQPIYATVSFIGGAIMIGGLAIGLTSAASSIAAVASVIVLRLLALRFNWHLPEIHDESIEPPSPRERPTHGRSMHEEPADTARPSAEASQGILVPSPPAQTPSQTIR